MCKQHKFIARREFLKYASMTAAGAALLPYLRPTVAFAQGSPPLSGPIDIYIRIYFAGGVDGLTMVVPRDPSIHGALKAQRPILMGPPVPILTSVSGAADTGLIESPSQVLDIGRTWGLHPYWGTSQTPQMAQNQLLGVHQLVNQGQAKILSKIGFPGSSAVTGSSSGPEHDLNHVTATDPWNVGKAEISPGSDLFWEVRLMQQAQLQWNQFWVLGVGGYSVPPRPYSGGPSPTRTRFLKEISRFSVNDYDVRANGQSFGGSIEADAAQAAIQQLLSLPDAGDTAIAKKEYKRGMRAALDSADFIKQNIAGITLPNYFPGPEMGYPYAIDENFKDLARIINYYHFDSSRRRKLFLFLSLPNFDTHSAQDAALPRYLRAINHCIVALHKYLVANNAWSKTVIQFVSEFGRGISTRSLDGNGNPIFLSGTPHGWGSMHFILGGALNQSLGPVIGDLPTILDITNPVPVGNPSNPESTLLRATLDPREVFFHVVEGMGFQPAPIFTGFNPAGVQIFS